MTRKRAWAAVFGAILSGSMAQAQGPMPGLPPAYANPAAYGNPQPMMPPYGNPQPMMPPYGNPQPMMPFGMPVARPAATMPGQPVYDGAGPKAGAAEPYLVPSDPVTQPTAPTPAPKKVLTLPPANAKIGTSPNPSTPVDFLEPMGPPEEPYTVYEGPRSLAEVRQDNTTCWVQGGAVHWWIRRDDTPPLVTTGDPNKSSGAFGAPDTTVLLGNGSIGASEFTGAQVTAGMWLDEEKLYYVEGSGFYLGQAGRQYAFASDAHGNPVLSQPVIVGGIEKVIEIATPGTAANPVDLAGRINASTNFNLSGAEVNFGRNWTRTNGFTLDYFAGVRYLYMNESLNLDQSITSLPGANNQVAFLGVPQPAGTNFALNDSFSATNRYFGGQVGAKVDWAWHSLDVSAIMKIGAGATFTDFEIGGTSTLNATNGTHTTVQGGTLAQASNIGSHNSTEFSVVPEFVLTLGYQITPWLRLTTGYEMLYWTHVMRVGNNIDRNLDPGQAPTLAFPAVTPGTLPHFPGIRTEFWAQGVNVGMEVKY